MCKISNQNSKRLLRKQRKTLGGYFFAAPCRCVFDIHSQCVYIYFNIPRISDLFSCIVDYEPHRGSVQLRCHMTCAVACVNAVLSTEWSKKRTPIFWDNFGNSAPILTILSLLQAEIYGA